MKKNFFQLIPILVIIIAATGYSFIMKNKHYSPDVKASNEYCDTCKRCESCKPKCEPCRACEICCPKPCCESCKPCCTEVPMTGEPCNCAYNAPARIDPACGWDAWISGSFIYWQAIEKGLDTGAHIITNVGESTVDIDPLNMEFNYHPGFKVGAGLSFCRDDWTLYLEYTGLKTHEHKSTDISSTVNEDINVLISPWMVSGILFDSARLQTISAKWKLSYNVLDLELGRPFYLGKKLVFKPHCGLRGGWIDQRYNVFLSLEPQEDLYGDEYLAYKQNTWLIGPRIGVDTDWLINCNFRIFVNSAASLTYQNFQVNMDLFLIAHDESRSTDLKMSNKKGYLTPNVECSLGLGYGTYFNNNEWYFDLSAGYDFVYYWNQNFIRAAQDAMVSRIDGELGNLMLHGLTITARVDF